MNFRTAVQCLALIAFMAALSMFENSPGSELLRRSLEGKPIIYTFLESKFPDGLPKHTGMTEEDDQALLERWKHYWAKAGWEPRVLTLDDAKAHPSYVDYVKALAGISSGVGYYDRLCFLRWLAVAHVTSGGGGWISDYDTFPLEDFSHEAANLPNEGRFTTYENIVPSLVSASSIEFLRMALEMLDNARQNKDEAHWSDMKALADMHKMTLGKAFQVNREVLGGIEALNGVPVWREEDCASAKGKKAVHFSHHSMDKGITAFPAHARDRPKVASDWLDMWDESCGSGSSEKVDKQPPARETETESDVEKPDKEKGAPETADEEPLEKETSKAMKE